MDKELKKDLKMLAKLVYDLGKKHGDIYITATHCSDTEQDIVSYGNGPIKSIAYWGDTKKYTVF